MQFREESMVMVWVLFNTDGILGPPVVTFYFCYYPPPAVLLISHTLAAILLISPTVPALVGDVLISTPKKLTKEQLDFLKTIKVEFQVDEKKSFTIELNPELVKKIQAAGKEAAHVVDTADDDFPSWSLICGIFVLPLPIWCVFFILWAVSVFVAYLGMYLMYFIRAG
ncbi:hypothetical protein ACLB2K_074532 [Fragaria x ananassa]